MALSRLVQGSPRFSDSQNKYVFEYYDKKYTLNPDESVFGVQGQK
jgi:hypothetical protein